jgi:hypothetical protein
MSKKKYYKIKLICALLFISLTNISYSQNIGIGTITPDASAALEIKDSTKGILIPRMTMNQRNAIQNPAEGLMVYQSDSTKGYWYYDGAVWKNISNSNNNVTINGILPISSGGTGANSVSDARTNLGASTVGSNLFTLPNPSSQKFIRVNADNTVTARSGGETFSDITSGYAGIVGVDGTYGTTVYNSLVTPSSIILVTTQQLGGNQGRYPALISNKSYGSFTIIHNLSGNLQVAYLIINP